MRLVRTFLDAAAFRGAAVSIGNFDGVHRGHQAMLATLVAEARQRGVPSMVMTFDPHPIRLLAPEKAPPSLMTLEQKAAAIGELGIDCLLGYPTQPALLELTAVEFFERIIRDHLMAAGLVEGPNFQFGRRRSGDVALLADLCEQNGMFLRVLQPVQAAGGMVSSSRVRAAIAAGDAGLAGDLLGRPYELAGVVARGDARGRTLGFPTANLDGIQTLIPAAGVYAGTVRIAGRDHAAAVHIGGNPTFGVDQTKVEAHLLDFDGDLYGQTLAVALHDRVRGVRQFDGPEDLKRQLAEDIAAVRRFVELNVGEQESR